jgi:Lon-like protease
VSRRTLTLLLASLLALGLTSTASVARVPYVALGPGPTFNTLGEVEGDPLIEVEGRETFPTDGRLELTTVLASPRELTLAKALRGWLDPDLAVVPRETVFPTDRTPEQIRDDNTASMVASQESATMAALRQIGVEGTPEVVVRAVSEGAPADGRLQPDDVLTSVDGVPVSTADALREQIAARSPGDRVRIGYLRGGRAGEATISTAPVEQDGVTRAVIGVVPGERLDFPFDVSIRLRDVGGPSAGLMFALGIIDKLEPASLTEGRFIAGTGAIDGDGRVRPIGGISQKLQAAGEKGAEAFLVPAANCPEAVRNAPDDLLLVRAGTLAEALTGLQALREGSEPPSCST